MTTWLERWPAGGGDGPTVAVKDLIDVAGTVTTAGCRTLADLAVPAPVDARCIADIRRAGGRLVGKTNLHELAFGTSGINPWFGTPPNPADPGRVPGGSSSGSAAAVALGEADFALGSDTGGSVRIPAACCAVVGLKTTHGLISLEGVWPLAPSYDTVGVLARDVARVVLGMRMLGVEMLGVEMPGVDKPVGDVPEVVGRIVAEAVEIDPVIDAAVDAALLHAGLRSETVRMADWVDAHRAQQRLLVEEAFQCDRHLLEIDGGSGVSDEIRARLQSRSRVTAADLAAARALELTWTARLADVLGRYGVLALPTLAVRPPLLDEFGSGFNVLTSPVNFAGFPALSMPVPVAGGGPGRPPCGLQLVGLPGSEALLCTVAARVEAAVGQ
ncbi:MAG: amidase [Acidimicrobiales bacterium]|jgi:amidase